MKKKLIAALFSGIGLLAFSQNQVDVVFMHDVHSFLNETPRAKVVIDSIVEENPDTLIVDAGDFSMGTLYQTVFATKASELQVLGALGVEATTFGNHEFDFGGQRLSNMFKAASESKNSLPEFVVCNVDWSVDDDFTNTVKSGIDLYGHSDYVIVKKGDINIALIGVYGKDAEFCAPANELTILDQVESVKKTVSKIKAAEKADMIVLLSHSGTSEKISQSEDHLMARSVPEIDLIVSGHTHTTLNEPIVVGNTSIVSCGAFFANLGKATMTRTEKGRWQVSDYKLYPMKDASLPEDPGITEMLKEFNADIDSEYLSRFGFKSRQVIGHADRDLIEEKEMGYLLGEFMRYGINEAGYDVDLVVVPTGMKREIFKKGDITVSDAFETFSLGIGKDGLTGYPFIYAYISGKDVKNLCEIDCSISPFVNLLRLFMTGISYDYNPHRCILNKVTDVYLVKNGERVEKIDENKMYSIAVDYYTSRFLGQISDLTKGLITIQGFDKDGNVISDFLDAIMYDSDGNEVKCWITVAKGLRDLGIPSDIDNRDAKARISKASWNPVDIFSHPTKFAVLLYCVIIFVILLIALIVVLIVKAHKRRVLKRLSKA